MGLLDFATRNTGEVISGTSVRYETAGKSADDLADLVTGDDPNDDIDLGQWTNKVIPGTPLAAAEEFGGPKEPETWEEDGGPFDVSQSESENTVGGWANNVTIDTVGLESRKLLWLVVALAALYLLKPVLELVAGAAEAA